MKQYLSPRRCVELMRSRGVICPSYETVRQLAIHGKVKSRRRAGIWLERKLREIDTDSLEDYLREMQNVKADKSGPGWRSGRMAKESHGDQGDGPGTMADAR
jgi:hypothetical protein